MINDSEASRRAVDELNADKGTLPIKRVPTGEARKQHLELSARYQAYTTECARNGVLGRDYADWLEYYNINPS